MTRPLDAELIARLERGSVDEVILTLPGDERGWDLPRWPGGRLVRRIADAGVTPRIMCQVRSLASMDHPDRMDLLRLTARGDARLALTPALPMVGGRLILALLRHGSGQTAILSPDDTAGQPDAEWALVDRMPLIAGPAPQFDPGHLVEAVDLAKHGLPNSVELPVLHQLDGPLDGFGRRFWALVKGARPQAFRPTQKLLHLRYCDRYLFGPMPAALLMRVLAAAPGNSKDTVIHIESEATRPRFDGGPSRDSYQLRHNWHEDTIRTQVLH